jgi:3-carboxy-cis,cis-muconate cycloisomerase
MFVPSDLRAAVSDQAWLTAMLEAERALASAEATVGLIPARVAGPIAERCRPGLFDAEQLAAAGRTAGTPVEPLVRRLTELVGGEAAGYVHWGATSQDIMDSAAMLVTRRALDLILGRLDTVAGSCAGLAEAYRTTPMAARTLLQQAVPTSFGLKAAGWLNATLDARERVADLSARRLAAQLGGAAGTLSALGEHWPAVTREYARELGLAEPELPWHSDRGRVAEIGAGLAVAAGTMAKIGRDVVLLSQVEVGEVVEAAAGGSSTMPQKRNPVSATLAIACARNARAQAGVLLEALEAEHERAAGAWQAEWPALSGALAATGGAADAVARSLHGLVVRPERMAENLAAGGGLIMAERVAYLLAPERGRLAARDVVAAAAARTHEGASFRDALAADPQVGLSHAELDVALDPAGALGAAPELVDRALARHRALKGGAA